MKAAALLVAVVCFLLASLQVGEIWRQYKAVAVTAELAYSRGYAAGKAANTEALPKVCTAWWFGEDTKARHQQAKLAYCKGSK